MSSSYEWGKLAEVLELAQSRSASKLVSPAVAYSGPYDDSVHTGAVAQVFSTERGAYRIDDTELGDFLGQDATWEKATGEINEQLEQQGSRPLTQDERFVLQEPAWRAASERFALEARGDIHCVVRDPDQMSVFVANELPVLLANENVTSINETPRQELAASPQPLTEIGRTAGVLFAVHAERAKAQRQAEAERKAAGVASLDGPGQQLTGQVPEAGTTLAESGQAPQTPHEAELRQIAQEKALSPTAEIKPAGELGKREITGKVLGYTADKEAALFQRTGGGLVALDTGGKPPLPMGKQIDYDVRTGTISRSGLSR